MKSIKEQAKELEIEVFRTTRSKDVAERCKWSYIKGAKYVLDILEKELPLENNRNLNDYGKALVWRLKERIEQLKK